MSRKSAPSISEVLGNESRAARAEEDPQPHLYEPRQGSKELSTIPFLPPTASPSSTRQLRLTHVFSLLRSHHELTSHPAQGSKTSDTYAAFIGDGPY